MIAFGVHGFEPTVDRAQLGPLGKAMGNPGQCLAVSPLEGDPNTLFKEYRPGQLTAADEERLRWLVELPSRLSELDRDFLLSHAAWPVSRVTEGGRTVGVLIPLAPDRFYERITDPYGSQRMPLILDHLAMPDRELPLIGLCEPDLELRLDVCGEILTVAGFFERQGLVYGDWGYQNIFWSQRDSSVYFIDVDGCSFGPQAWVESFGFEDSLTPQSAQVDEHTERFRCAVVVAACLTGEKHPSAAVKALTTLAGQHPRLQAVANAVRGNIDAVSRAGRASIAEMLALLPTDLSEPFEPSGSRDFQAPGESTATARPICGGDNIEGWEEVEPAPSAGGPASGTGSPATWPNSARLDRIRTVQLRAALVLTALAALAVLIIVLAAN